MAKLTLDKLLKRDGVTKYELARRLGLRPPSVQAYFQKGYNPTLQVLARIATVLECQISDLYDESKDRPRMKKAW